MKKPCSGLFDHSLENLETTAITRNYLTKSCKKCGYKENLKRSEKGLYFLNQLVLQKKKWASEENRMELLQPMKSDGSVNEDFTDAYGYNPFDERTKEATPKIQGGLAE